MVVLNLIAIVELDSGCTGAELVVPLRLCCDRFS